MTFVKSTICAHCGQHHELATAVCAVGDLDASESSAPADGDASICMQCGHWNMIDSGCAGSMRKLTDDEMRELTTRPAFARLNVSWQAMNQERKRGWQ